MTQQYQQNTINQEPGAPVNIAAAAPGPDARTLSPGEGLIVVDESLAQLDLTLPLAADAPGQIITVQNFSGTNSVTFATQTPDTISGAGTALAVANAVAQFQSDGVATWVQIV